jgi:ribosomal protein S12 methylthiotransferase accessory factor
VARVTGLDRTGVEVASAIRPGAHVLQVTNGKGESFEDAARGALMEAAELWAAERVVAGPFGSVEELRRRSDDATVIAPPALLSVAGEDATEDGLRIRWRPALTGGRAAWVPAQAVECPPPGAPLLGVAPLRWTSNGMGAHPRRGAALLHALLEAVERDQLARALPQGFTTGALARRLLDPATLAAAAPRTAALVRRLEARGFGVHLLDAEVGAGSSASRARPAGADLGLPVAAAIVLDREGGPVPVAAGYACRLGRDDALRAALLEACQSRATEIHGAREDVLHGDRHSAAPLARLLARAHPTRPAGAMPDLRAASPAAGVRLVLTRLRHAGFGASATVDLPAPAGFAVVKVLVPGLLVSELL